MATNFPSSLDNFTNPVSGNTLDSPSHSLQHSDANDAIEAIEAKLGIGNSPAGSATSGQVLTAQGGGTALWATPTPGGLVQLIPSSVTVGSGSGSVNENGRVTFTGANSVSLNDVFNSTYTNYKILINSNIFNTLNLRYRVSGSDNTTSNYNNAYYAFESRGIAEFNGYGEGATTHSITGTNCDEESYAILEIGNPFASTHTSLHAFLSAGVSTTGYKAFHILGNGRFRATTSFTGFTFYGSSNMTGTISVYGYK